MGSYYELAVGDFVVDTGKNYVPDHVIIPFQEKDLDTETGRSDDCEPYVYRATARTVARRLDLLGYTARAAKRAYVEGYAGLEEWQHKYVPADLASSTGFETWCSLARQALAAAREKNHLVVHEVEDERLKFMLGGSDKYVEDNYLGFVRAHPLSVLRAVLSLVTEEEPVTLDLTDLVAGGWVKEDGLHDGEEKEPVIVLTEGKSDSRLLRSTLDVLAPEFGKYISFIDFETANAKGGTDELVQFVRMFIGCGIRNRIVVLFDNDAAGHEALQRLLEAKLPAHVFAMTLPPLESARAYPTLGPEGPSTADINGRACSLELYLGQDVLLDRDGKLLPVRWTGFNDKLQRYQGQVTNKSAVQKRFDEKLTQATRDGSLQSTLDFAGVTTIFDAIFSAVGER